LLLVCWPNYRDRVFDRLSNPVSACVSTAVVIKIHINCDGANLILVFPDFLKQRKPNNAAIENPPI